MHCTNCGKKLNQDAKFCDACGTPVAEPEDSTRKIKYTGEVQKCPNCGEILKSFMANCPSCGYEIRNSKLSHSIKEFTRKLEELEAQREGRKNKKDRKTVSKTDEKIANLIKNYSVPNNKEDIFEFIILATSNINYDTYTHLRRNASERAVADAWLVKAEQIYKKAKISFNKDPQFEDIKNLYEGAVNQVAAKKKRRTIIILLIVGGFVAYYLITLLIAEINTPALSPTSPAESRENHLNYVVNQIERDISNGDYNDARNKAYTLTFDRELDSERHDYWEKKQEAILEQIDKASKNANK